MKNKRAVADPQFEETFYDSGDLCNICQFALNHPTKADKPKVKCPLCERVMHKPCLEKYGCTNRALKSMDKVAFVCCNKPTQFKSADVKMALILGVHSCLLSIPLYPITVLYIIMTKELKMIRDQMSYGKNGVCLPSSSGDYFP